MNKLLIPSISVYRRPFTLLEVLIALSLTLIIFSTLVFFYRQMDLINRQLDRAQNENFQQLYLGYRLGEILPKAVAANTSSRDFFFYTTPGYAGLIREGTSSLVWTFDNCVSLDKEFSNHVLGRLFVDPDGKLMLGKWPSPKRWEEGITPPMKIEVLYPQVENLEFRFFIPPKQESSERVQTGVQPEPPGEWIDQWQKEYRQLPTLVKVLITIKNRDEENETWEFAYPLIQTKKPIRFVE